MPGTRSGGLKARETNLRRHGKDFYKSIGAKGGKLAPGPFRADPELARRAGKIGGAKSRRGPAKQKPPVKPVKIERIVNYVPPHKDEE
jgi:uncharacterized protein